MNHSVNDNIEEDIIYYNNLLALTSKGRCVNHEKCSGRLMLDKISPCERLYIEVYQYPEIRSCPKNNYQHGTLWLVKNQQEAIDNLKEQIDKTLKKIKEIAKTGQCDMNCEECFMVGLCIKLGLNHLGKKAYRNEKKARARIFLLEIMD